MINDPFDRLLNRVGKIVRPDYSGLNEFGERKSKLVEIGVINCLVQPLRERFSITRYGEQYVVESVCYTRVCDVREGDYLLVNSDRYLIVGVENEGGVDHHYKLLLSKV